MYKGHTLGYTISSKPWQEATPSSKGDKKQRQKGQTPKLPKEVAKTIPKETRNGKQNSNHPTHIKTKTQWKPKAA